MRKPVSLLSVIIIIIIIIIICFFSIERCGCHAVGHACRLLCHCCDPAQGIPFFSIHALTLESDPDKYTIVPAPLKILKVLVVELQSASGAPLDAQAAAELAEEDSGDDDWEDEANPFVDLGSGFSREQLMAFAAEEPGGGRQRDDETQGFLVDFFKRAATTQGFAEEFGQLTEEEQQRLRDSAA